MNAQLRDLINAVLPDLEHYAATHGPGPDQRLRDLKHALNAGEPKLHQRDDGTWIILDCAHTPFWYAFFHTEEKARLAWKLRFNTP